jgi:putative ABC transport system permease protein
MPLRLVFAHLRRRWLRVALTIASLAIAIFLLAALRALVLSLESGVRGAASNRLVVQSAVSLFVQLPIAYQSRIQAIPGVEAAGKWQWFGGKYVDNEGEEHSMIAQFAVDPESLVKTYPEIELVDGSVEPFLTRRNACIVGASLIQRYDWKVGDVIRLMGTLYKRSDGRPWELEIAGVYKARMPVDDQTIFFPFEYLIRAGESGEMEYPVEGTGTFAIRVAEGADPDRIAQTIDAEYANGPIRTQTMYESEFNRQFVGMVGNIPTLMGAIGAAVAFAVVLAVLNTMVMGARERTRDVGILKALGFTDRTVFAMYLVESLLICGAGGLIGLGFAEATENSVRMALEANWYPGYAITSRMLATGVVVSVAMGLLAGLYPAWQASRLRPVDALRMEV